MKQKKTKKGLTIEEHRSASLRMKQIHLALLDLKIIFCAAYSRRISPALPLANAIKVLMKARCMAESHLYEEHPQKADTIKYFGPVADEEKSDH